MRYLHFILWSPIILTVFCVSWLLNAVWDSLITALEVFGYRIDEDGYMSRIR